MDPASAGVTDSVVNRMFPKSVPNTRFPLQALCQASLCRRYKR